MRPRRTKPYSYGRGRTTSSLIGMVGPPAPPRSSGCAQPIANDGYRAYVCTELNSALALIELLDSAQHVDEFDEFEQQYEWVILRVEVAIRHILTLWKARIAQ